MSLSLPSGPHRLRFALVLSCTFFLSACGRIGIDSYDNVRLEGSGGKDGLPIDHTTSAGGEQNEVRAVGGSTGLGGEGEGSGGAESAAGGDSTGVGVGGDVSSSGGSDSGGTDAGGTNSGGADVGGVGGSLSEAGGSDGAGGSLEGVGGEGVGAGGAVSSGGTSGVGGMMSTTGGAGSNDCNLTDPLCAELSDVLVNRYSFEGNGAAITDSLGGAIGTARGGAVLDGSGKIDLSGMSEYVELPPALISSFANVTFEIWFVWRGGDAWQKLFEFGAHDGLSDPVDYLYVTPLGGGTNIPENALAGAIRHNNSGERQVRSTALTELGVLTHVVLVVNDDLNRMSLYKNGEWLSDRDVDIQLDKFMDETNRLGRSLFSDDPGFNGEIHEFRIYGEALNLEMIEKSYSVGPDAVFSTN